MSANLSESQIFDLKGTLMERLCSLVSPAEYDTTYLTHGLHPYAAKYIPQLPRLVIQEHTNERNTVLDPFCGSGTTLLEAALLGRKSIGVDANPIACLISRAKTTALTDKEIEILEGFDSIRSSFKKFRVARDLIRNESLSHWFDDSSIVELAYLQAEINGIRSINARQFLQAIFSSIIVSVSRQESETRYAAKDKGLQAGDVIARFSRKLRKELLNVKALSALDSVIRNQPKVINTDLRSLGSRRLADNTVDLVVTSPPYPNSYDYYLYHKWRMFWLGFDASKIKEIEIGSRNEHSSRKEPIGTYVEKMREALGEVARVMKPSKLAYFFAGDAVINGELINIAETFDQIVSGTNLRLIEEGAYDLHAVSRSFREKSSDRCHGGSKNEKKKQRVLVLERVNPRKRAVALDRRTAPALPVSVPQHLGPDIESGAIVSLVSEDSTRHIHSLGRYPSKFIPELPRWAIENYCEPGDVVLDPFSGSGTTSVEAVLLGRNAIASDFSPYSCLLTTAKTTRVSGAALSRSAERFNAVLQDVSLLPNVPQPSFELSDFWFDSRHLRQLSSLKEFVRNELPKAQQPFFLAVVSTVIRGCSYQDEGQIKVKRDPKKVLQGTPSPVELLRKSFPKQLKRMFDFLERADPAVKSTVINCSAGSLTPELLHDTQVDLVVTSPPYINAMNYPMTHRYENVVLGLLDHADKVDHETGYFGTERVYARDYNALHQFGSEFSMSRSLNVILGRIFESEPKRSYIVYKYFVDMMQAWTRLAAITKPGGYFVLVAGRNTVRNVSVPTFEILVSIAESCGFILEKKFDYEIIKNAFKLTRHKTADIIALDGVAVMKRVSAK